MSYAPLTLDTLGEPVPKAFRRGTHRAVAPEETLARVGRLMPALGITRIANITGLDTVGLPVVVVTRPNARSLAVSQGKGLDLAAAKASGLMEAVEGYHAEHITLPLKLASYEELRYSHPLADVERLPRDHSGLFDPERPILWVEGLDIVGGGRCWVPFELVHTNYTLAMHGHSAGFLASSNGLASGNHLLEAICHGIYEVVERDAHALWLLRGEEEQAATRVRLDSVDDSACRSVLARFAAAEVLVGVWEITSDVGIPAFLCRVVDASESALRRLCYAEGMGCHPAREVALLRALTEAAQSRVTLIAGVRDDCFPEIYQQLRDPDLLDRQRREIAFGLQERPFAAAPTWEADTLNADLAWALERLAAAGFEQVIVVDLSRPELRVPVARVIIPGMEHISDKTSYTLGRRARALLGRGL